MMLMVRMLIETNEKGELDLHVDTNMPRSSVEVAIVLNALEDAGKVAADKEDRQICMDRRFPSTIRPSQTVGG